jgi:hypothetical protein
MAMTIQDDSMKGRISCEVENQMQFDADYVDLEVDTHHGTGTLRHEIGGHARTHYFNIDLIDESSGSEDGFFIEGETEHSEQEIIIDTGLGEYSVGGTAFNIDNNTFLTAKFENPGVELGVSPDHYDCVIVDKRGYHYNPVRFNVCEVVWDYQDTHEQTHIEGVTEYGDEISVEPEEGFYEITKTHDHKTFDGDVVTTGSDVGKSWESNVDNSATEPKEPIGTISYESSDDDKIEVNTMTGEMRIDSANVEPISCEVTVGSVDEEESTVTTCDDPEFRDIEDDELERESLCFSNESLWEDTEPEMMGDDSESSEQAESSNENDSSDDRDEEVSFLDDVTYEPY